MLAKRIIPCLDLKDGRVVKGTNFIGLRDAGDPVERANFYYKEGADEIVLSGEKDETPIETVRGVARKWGGAFRGRYCADWKRFLRSFRGTKVHLTMYGSPLQQKIGEIRRARRKKNILVVVGAEKVPRCVYEACDYNVAVGSQPHSEVAALAVFLHELFEGKELSKAFKGAEIRITPNPRGKTVLKTKRKENHGKQAGKNKKTN